MKSLSTIRKQITRLKKVAQDDKTPPAVASRAYDAWHALRWVAEDVAWNPAATAESDAKCKGGQP